VSDDRKTYVVHDPRNTGKPRPHTIVIDPEFESLIAPLSPEERAQLKANILDEDGFGHVREPLIAWTDESENVALLDGHTRLSILEEGRAQRLADGATSATISAPVNVMGSEHIRDRAAALLWIEENQVGRRNLTDDQRAVIWDSIRERRSAKAKAERAANARAAQDGPLVGEINRQADESETKRDIRKEVAAESGLPESKLRAVAELKKAAPEKVEEVRAGKTSLRDARKAAKKTSIDAKKKEAVRRYNAAKRELKTIMGSSEYVALLDDEIPLPEEMQTRLDKASHDLTAAQQELEAMGEVFMTPAEKRKARRDARTKASPTMTWDAFMDWWHSPDTDGDWAGDVHIEPHKNYRQRTLTGKVRVSFAQLDPAIAKKLLEAYARIRPADSPKEDAA
jgi:hypothetical protein